MRHLHTMYRFTYDRILPTLPRDTCHREISQHEYMRIFFGTLWTRIHSQMCLVLLLPQESCLGSESDPKMLGEGLSECDWALPRERYDMRKIYGVYLLRDEMQKCNIPSLCIFYLPHWKCSPRKTSTSVIITYCDQKPNKSHLALGIKTNIQF